MKRFVAVLFLSSLSLSGCGDNKDNVAGIADLNARNALNKIEALEKRVEELEKRQSDVQPKTQPTQQVIQATERNRFMLVGPRTLMGSGTEFPSLQRCENARASLIQQAAERAERQRAQGIISLGEPQVSCMPL